jgi:hypothetical protein
MLALLSYIESLSGKRNLIAFAVLAVLSVTALDLTMLARNAFETFIQKQAATYSEPKAKGEADVATATAREKEAQAQLAAEVAANAKLRQQMEALLAQWAAREKNAQARTAEEVAGNAKLRQMEETLKIQQERLKTAEDAITAGAIAKNSGALQLALAEKAREEGRKAAADADLAEAKAVQEAVIAKAFNPNFRTSQEAAAAPEGSGKRTQPVSPADGVRAAFEAKIRAFNQLSGGTDNPASAQNASAASGNGGRRMYEVNLCAADRLMGHASITDGIGCHDKPAEQQPVPRDSIGGRRFEQNLAAADRLTGGTGDPLHNGILAKAEPLAAAAHDKQIEEDCKRRLAGFATMKDHAAIAVTPNSGCSWTAGQPTKQAAVAVVMNQCAKANVKTCSIAFAR